MSVHEKENELIWESSFPKTQTRDIDKSPITSTEIEDAYNSIENSLHIIDQDLRNKIKDEAKYDGAQVDWNDKYYQEKLFNFKQSYIKKIKDFFLNQI